jgi:hypothetical protein
MTERFIEGFTLSDEFLCPTDYSDAPKDYNRCVPSLNHCAVETFDPYSAEIPLNIQIMSRILEDQQMLRFNCLGDFSLKSHLRTFCTCCDTSPSGTLNLLRKIRIATGQTITIPDETTIREFFIRNPDITLSIPGDLSCLSPIP